MRDNRVSAILLAVLLVLVARCGGGDDATPFEPACTFNESRPCECPDDAVGVQYCNSELSGFGKCFCPEPDVHDATSADSTETVDEEMSPPPETHDETMVEVTHEVCEPTCTGLTCGNPDGCGGVCECDDGLDCTFSTCTSGTCTFELKPNHCLVDDVCAFSGEDNPSEPCQACDPAMAQHGWTNKPDGTPCGDGHVCAGGVCCGQACEDKMCGDDGCGGSCGSCGVHEACFEETGMCVAAMAPIPAGSSWMGCKKAGACDDDELPFHLVVLDAYEVDVTEVTNAQFATFLNEHGADCGGQECADIGTPDLGITANGDNFEAKYGKEDWPVVEVSWYGANAYCHWAGKALCTEAQWEKAARGGCELYIDCEEETPYYPWGSAPPTCSLAVINEDGQGCGTGNLMDVASKASGVSPYGAYDMAGNAWEWVADWYGSLYYTVSPEFAPTGPIAGDAKVDRGGGFVDYSESLKSYHRSKAAPSTTKYSIGFRCCSD